MANPSEVKAGLDNIAQAIVGQRLVVAKAIQNAGVASASLADLPTTYADVIATINGYGTADAFEAVSKAELAKMTEEFIALKAVADQIAAESV
jgi:hypothetical protein